MPRSDDLYSLPPGLPVPIDDGACAHLTGLAVPGVALAATSGDRIDLASLTGTTVIYAYPRTGHPDRDPPPGWDDIPGARGCTPQSCAFRDLHAEIAALGARIFGLSTQTTDEQREVRSRLHLPFELLSDAGLVLTGAMRLPTFTIAPLTLLKRFTLLLRDGRVEKVFYPVFPPDRNAADVRDWLAAAR
jgi:peroxiredoxin